MTHASSSRSRIRAIAAVAFMSALPFLAACPKKDVPAAPDAYVAPVPTDSTPLDLTTLLEDAGQDAAPEAAVVHHAGPSGNTNQVRARQCCAALRSQAKQMGASPEANMVMGIALQCDVVAAQIGPTAGGQAPELAPLRNMLKGRTMPPVCQGL
jgi:hypothetical protein